MARKHDPILPGFKELAERRQSLTAELATRRVELGLSQTEVAARMGTSQSAVARLETGDADVRVSTLERYAAAIGSQLAWQARAQPGAAADPMGPGQAGLDAMGTSPMRTGPAQPGLTG